MNRKQLKRIENTTRILSKQLDGMTFKVVAIGSELMLWADNGDSEISFSKPRFFMATVGKLGGMRVLKNSGFVI
jgi:hypothetical protein